MSTGYAPITPEQEFAGLSANEAAFGAIVSGYYENEAVEPTYGELAPRVDAETGLGATALQSEVDADFELSASDLDILEGVDLRSLTDDLTEDEVTALDKIDSGDYSEETRQQLAIAHEAAMLAIHAELETKKLLEEFFKSDKKEDDEEKED